MLSKVSWHIGFVMVASLCYCGDTLAQEVKVRGGFVDDSLRIGDETAFYLSARYPSDRNLIFPDTSFDFSPFEFRKKTYFATATTNGVSHDSVIYYLATFEVDSVQRLALPVFELLQKDSAAFLSSVDSIYLNHVVSRLPDTLSARIPVRSTVAYQRVSYQLNIPLITVILAVLLVATAAVWFVFGKRIQQYYYLKRLVKAHVTFTRTFKTHVETAEKNFSTQNTELAVSLWKRYMETLHAKPYTKLTAREILAIEKDDLLGQTLRHLDAAIYGHNTNVLSPLNNLQMIADDRFTRKMEALKNG